MQQQQMHPGDALGYLVEIAKSWLSKLDGPAAGPSSVAVQSAVNVIGQALGLDQQPAVADNGGETGEKPAGDNVKPLQRPAMIPRSKKGR